MTARQVGRRDAAAGRLAMLVLAAAAAGSAKAEELDGELLQAAADFYRLGAEDRAAWAALPNIKAWEEARWDWCNSEEGAWTLIDAARDRVASFRRARQRGFGPRRASPERS